MALAEVFNNLFSEAKASGGMDYVFLLLRVDGITHTPDQLLATEHRLAEHDNNKTLDWRRARYCSLALAREPLELIANLVRLTRREPYSPAPFNHLWEGAFPRWEAPPHREIVADLVTKARTAGQVELAVALHRAYADEALEMCSSRGSVAEEVVSSALGSLEAVLSACFASYGEARRLPPGSHFHKGPRFEVVELLGDAESRQCGLKVHFSNGATSSFIRTSESTDCMNMSPRVDGVEFFVGDLDALRDEWRVGEKRLYEVGLPGRYNPLGEWKPLIYPGKSEDLQKEAVAFSDDPDVQGAFFYMLCTGHRVVEFVVRATIELPSPHVSIGGRLHLTKCDPVEPDQGWIVYDGTFDLESVDPEYVRSAIAGVGVALNRFMFAYGGVVDWRLKYRMHGSASGIATPTERDLELFDNLLKMFPTSSEAIVLDAAVDWFNRGSASRNPFTAFLCYYISIEGLVNNIANGVATFGIQYGGDDAGERRASRAQCIASKHGELYAADPERFVSEAYFECVVGVTERARRVTKAVFGEDHPYVRALFSRNREHGGESLSSVRGQIAHGQLTLASRDDEALVRERLAEIAEIAREFLTRLGLGLRAGDGIPNWSQQFRAGFSMADPRSVMVASRIEMLPTKDWRIRAEWCE